jgi:hypothetical protein
VWLSHTVALEDSLSRPRDYKLRCTLTTGVSQILYITKLISEIKVYSFQRSRSQAEAQNKESDKTVLYQLMVIIILLLHIFIKLLIKIRTIPAETGNGTGICLVSFTLFQLQG